MDIVQLAEPAAVRAAVKALRSEAYFLRQGQALTVLLQDPHEHSLKRQFAKRNSQDFANRLSRIAASLPRLTDEVSELRGRNFPGDVLYLNLAHLVSLTVAPDSVAEGVARIPLFAFFEYERRGVLKSS